MVYLKHEGMEAQMSNTITITIPSPWIEGLELDQDDLRQALQVGLAHLRQQQARQTTQVIQALLSTGRIRQLQLHLDMETPAMAERQTPPTLPDPPVSELIIAQRGEL